MNLVENLPEELKKLAMPLEKVRKVLKIAKEPVLETPVGDEEDIARNFIVTKCSTTFDTAIQSNLSESTTKILASLTPREKSFKNAFWNRHEHRSHLKKLDCSFLLPEKEDKLRLKLYEN